MSPDRYPLKSLPVKGRLRFPWLEYRHGCDGMKSCLIVDDSRVVRKVAVRIAADLGFACQEAEDGDQAFAICTETMPDAIILDWNMPVMSGLEFLEKLREMDHGDHPKVIFCTTENDRNHVQRAIRA